MHLVYNMHTMMSFRDLEENLLSVASAVSRKKRRITVLIGPYLGWRLSIKATAALQDIATVRLIMQRTDVHNSVSRRRQMPAIQAANKSDDHSVNTARKEQLLKRRFQH